MLLQKLLITEKVIIYYYRVRLFTATLTSVKEMEGKKETPVLAACVISYGDGHRAKENDTGHL